ncbi:hypothetical protein ASO20_00625 [Mycoplasma sp. (ex Biomphalaria glabrata)]|uniref:FprA family A-type flavoprotein n=1 Tax=Mycoplasma sp. (ex Biomphalaria glabrata) TaxID=1749074 RepID=UPI00073AB513|nr:FprA family A-type flavoprotein [Mycoplasma sp. (ex Biomphalaria glabrata)]ALV23181.1 hypothetical protein ASO20_00625 [Mycoplasma sp. (ex Biomphalaria glabrata)]
MEKLTKHDGLHSLQLRENLWYVGSQDHDIKIFDIIMVTDFGTSYNSYIYKTSEGYVLFETVKVLFYDEYIKKIKEVVGNDLSQIKYILVNHTEPDHSGSVENLAKLIPNIKIIGSKNTIKYLKEVTNIDDLNTVEAVEGKDLKIGNSTFQFLNVPMLHWPDSIYTYIKEEKILVTCDSFGSHYAFDDILMSKLPQNKWDDYFKAFQYYYTAIFSPFKKHVLFAIDKIKRLDYNLICCGHGPVLDEKIDFVVNKYKEWSTEEKITKKIVVIPYCTAYGYTAMMAAEIEKGIKSVDKSIRIYPYPIDVANYAAKKPEILTNIAIASAVVIGSCTINNDALPLAHDILSSLSACNQKCKIGAAFGSYGWSGEGVPNLTARLAQIGFATMKGLAINFKPSQVQLKQCHKYGEKIGNAIINDLLESDDVFKPISHKACLMQELD